MVEYEFGAEFEQFRNGLAVMRRDGKIAGHVATSLGSFRSIFTPRRRPWVWFVIVWIDGEKERSFEDYPPWSYIKEMREGYMDWVPGRPSDRAGRYEIEWTPPDETVRERDRLGVGAEDF